MHYRDQLTIIFVLCANRDLISAVHEDSLPRACDTALGERIKGFERLASIYDAATGLLTEDFRNVLVDVLDGRDPAFASELDFERIAMQAKRWFSNDELFVWESEAQRCRDRTKKVDAE